MKKVLIGAIVGLLSGIGIYTYYKHKVEMEVDVEDDSEFDNAFVDINMNNIIKE